MNLSWGITLKPRTQPTRYCVCSPNRRLRTPKRRRVVVRALDMVVDFDAGESILTEYSYKYDLRDLRDLAGAAGFAVKRVWLDERRYFSVQYLTVRSGGSAAGE